MFILFLILIFIRPFVSSSAFPYLNLAYSFILLGFLFIWLNLKGIPIRKIQPLKYPLILFSLALIISVVFSIDKINSLKELYKYISGLLLFLIAASLGYKDRTQVIRTLVLAGFIIAILAIYQYFFGFRSILQCVTKERTIDPFVLNYIEGKRVFFPFVTPNTLAGYLAMIIPLTLTYKDKIWFILPLSFALLLTKSLGALLSLFLALGIYFYLRCSPRPGRGLQDKLRKKRILFLFGLLAVIGLVFVARTIGPKEHLKPIFSTAMRLNYWRATLRIIGTAPLTGVGLGNFNLIQSRYAHNSYLQIWAETGILGIISFLWLIISVLKFSLKAFADYEYKNQISGIVTACVVFLIHNFVDFSFFLPEVALTWWLILGFSKL